MQRFFIFGILLFLFSNLSAQKQKFIDHKIEKGDKLLKLAKEHNVPVEAILKYNPTIKDDSKIKVGQIVKIPVFLAKKEVKTVVQKVEKETHETTQKPTATKSKPIQSATKSSVYAVEKGNTFYSISKKFNVTVQEILDANHFNLDTKLSIGQKIKIPMSSSPINQHDVIETKSVETFKPVPTPNYSASEPQLVHVVEQGDNLASIAKKYTLSVDELCSINKITPSTKLTNGELLIVGNVTTELPSVTKPTAVINTPKKEIETTELPKSYQEPTTEKVVATESNIKETVTAEPVTVISSSDPKPTEYTEVFADYEKASMKRKTIRGIAGFFPKGTVNNINLAHYNYAEMGSILKVTNLMSKKYVFVKVVGKLSEEDAQKDMIIKISDEMMNELKVNEDRFLVEVASYSK